MLHKCALYLASILLKNQAISEEDLEIYVYGWEMILSTAGATLAILIISVLFKQFLGSLLYMLFFITLRSYAGGYHANSYLGCFLITITIYLGALAVVYFTAPGYILTGMLALLPISIFLVFWRAPQDHPNRPLDTEAERRKFTKRSRFLVLAQATAILLIYYWQPQWQVYLWWATLGITAAGCSLLVSNWREQPSN